MVCVCARSMSYHMLSCTYETTHIHRQNPRHQKMKTWQMQLTVYVQSIRCACCVCEHIFSFSSSLSNTYWHIKRRQNLVYVSYNVLYLLCFSFSFSLSLSLSLCIWYVDLKIYHFRVRDLFCLFSICYYYLYWLHTVRVWVCVCEFHTPLLCFAFQSYSQLSEQRKTTYCSYVCVCVQVNKKSFFLFKKQQKKKLCKKNSNSNKRWTIKCTFTHTHTHTFCKCFFQFFSMCILFIVQ